MIKSFRYADYDKPKKKRKDLTATKWTRTAEDEGLTGYVYGQPASDLEERLARAFYKLKIPFAFQVPIQTRAEMAGQDKKVDFIIKGIQPVEPDGQYAHYRDAGERAHDMVRDLQLNEAFNQMGLLPIIHIPYWKLKTQEMTDLLVRRTLA